MVNPIQEISMANRKKDLRKTLKSALDQGLVTLYGIHKDTGMSRDTARNIASGKRRPTSGTEHLLWAYLREKGAV